MDRILRLKGMLWRGQSKQENETQLYTLCLQEAFPERSSEPNAEFS